MAERTKLNTQVIRRLLSYWKQYPALFIIALFCTLALGLISPLRPYLIGDMVNQYIVENKDTSQLLKWTLIIAGILVLETVLQFISSYFSNLFAQSIIRNLRKKLMRKLVEFRVNFFDKTPNGTLVTRVVQDMEAITDTFSSGMMEFIRDSIILIFILVAMFVSNWQLALIVLIPIPILLVSTRIFARVIRKSLQMESAAVTKLNTFVQERITGISLVQLFNREKEEFESFEKINRDHRRAHIKAIWGYSIFFPVVEILSALSSALLLVFAASVILEKTTESVVMFGTIVSFTLYIGMLFRPIRQLADKFNIIQRGTVRAERVFSLLDQEEQVQENGNISEVDFHSEISFNEVWFAYKNEDWVLKNISLNIPKGGTVAFVGATGAGKSTIVNLLTRFYDYQKGDVNIGGIEVKDIQLEVLRKNIAVVLQDVFLFSGSILENITLGDKSISKEQVIEASKKVGAHEFIMKLPDNYDFEIGERGGVLSVGQRQLISFIRAYVYEPSILILDEATSSVDNESEELIQQATEKLTQGRTSIVIAHRLSTIQSADQIVVMEQGEIIEKGSHEELLSLGGHYKQLVDKQFSVTTTKN